MARLFQHCKETFQLSRESNEKFTNIQQRASAVGVMKHCKPACKRKPKRRKRKMATLPSTCKVACLVCKHDNTQLLQDGLLLAFYSFCTHTPQGRCFKSPPTVHSPHQTPFTSGQKVKSGSVGTGGKAAASSLGVGCSLLYIRSRDPTASPHITCSARYPRSYPASPGATC